MKGLSKRLPIPLYVRICIVIGALSVTVLPILLLGAAWQRYRTEEAFLESQRALSRPKVEIPTVSPENAPR